jgi:16S rRNA (adenine1518-N6/adenine1519-N6)-dimethyltransferase
MYVLLQREMAERLAASPGGAEYGALSVLVQTVYRPAIIRRLPPAVFFPPPEVESCFLRLSKHQGERPGPARLTALAGIAREAFGQRRKKLTSSLGKRYGRERVAAALEAAGADPGARPQELSPGQFAALATQLAAPPVPQPETTQLG